MYNDIKWQLVSAKEENIDVLIKYKLNTIFEYANDLEEKEIIKIKNYVNSNVPKLINNYRLIIVDTNVVGCLLSYKKDDGILIDEIFIESNYRSNGIGTSIIKNVLNNNPIAYLWVYKLNIKAINLYKKLRFKIIMETETRYYMKYMK